MSLVSSCSSFYTFFSHLPVLVLTLELPGGEHTFQLIKHDYMLSGDSLANAEQRTFVAERLYRPSDTLDQVRQFYESITTDLIKRNSKRLGGLCQVDIVRE